ncbi:MAG: helix-turn-helix domain-containing protein [Novosphingobium sp.]
MDSIEQASPSYTATQIRIMLAAEALFAENGIDGASLREIAVAAKQRNPFAAQYHFGSREELIRAIFHYRMEQMEEPRGRMLLRAEREGRLHDPHAVMEMIYLPQVALVEKPENHGYATFLCQYLLRGHSTIYGDFGIPLPPKLIRILSLLRQSVPQLSDAAAQRRLVSSSLVFLHFLSVYGGRRGLEAGGETFEARLWDTLAQIEWATLMPITQGFPEGRLEATLDWIRD